MQNRKIKTTIIRVKSIGTEETIMAITLTKIIISTVLMTMMIIIMRIKIGNRIKISGR